VGVCLVLALSAPVAAQKTWTVAPAADYTSPPPAVDGPRIDATPVMDAPAFVGPEGFDAYGYPHKLPDRVAILTLLRLRRFDTLERWMGELQREFEQDQRKEQWPTRALSAFFVSDPKVTVLLDEWVEHSPDHFAPWLARGNHRTRIAEHARGTKWASETSRAQFIAMEDSYREAAKDFYRALALSPKSVAAYRTTPHRSASLLGARRRQMAARPARRRASGHEEGVQPRVGTGLR
jgi:hypothetical protein